MNRLATFLIAMFCCSLPVLGQFSSLQRAANAAEEFADLSNLITIATDIAETSSYTLDQLQQCNKKLSELDNIINSQYATSYMSVSGRTTWGKKIKWMAGNVNMYSSVMMNLRKILLSVKEQLVKQQSVDGEVGMAVKELVANVMKVVKDIPVYGQLIDGVASLFGAGSEDAAFIPITNAVKALDNEDKKQTAEEQLINFLIKINQLNDGIGRLLRDTELAKASIGNTMGYNLMISMPNRGIKAYAVREHLNIK